MPFRYNTMNAVEPDGSSDFRDAHDNTGNLDLAMNGAALAWTDRLGRSKKSWVGIEDQVNTFLARSGFELPPLQYVDGTPLVVDSPAKLIQRGGNLYSVKLPASFPVELSGTWSADEPLLVFRNDQSLRQELAEQNGGTLVGWKRTQLSASIDTIQQLADSIPIRVWEFAEMVSDKPSPDPSTWNWTPAFQAMVDTAESYMQSSGAKQITCYAGPGTFLIDSIVWRSGVHMYFGGAELKAHPDSIDGNSLINATLKLSDIGFYGPGIVNGDKDSFDPEHRQHGIHCVAKKVKVKDLFIENIGSSSVFSLGDGVIFRPTIPEGDFQCEDCEVSGCTFSNIERQCITVESGFNIRILSNGFYNSTYAALDIENAGYTMGDVDGVIFQGNYIDGCLYGVTAVTYQPVDAQRNIVCGGNIYKNVMDAYHFRGCSNVKVGYGDIAEVSRYGAYIYSDGATTVSNIEISDFTTSGGTYGVYAQTTSGGSFNRIKLSTLKITGTSTSPITVQSTSGLRIEEVDVLINTGAGVVIQNCASPIIRNLKMVGAVTLSVPAVSFIGTTTNPRVGGLDIAGFTVGVSVTTSATTTIHSLSNNVFAGVATPWSVNPGNYIKGQFSGTFTMNAAASMNVNSVGMNVTSSVVRLIPTNAAAATLQAGSKMAWVVNSASSNNVSFRVQTADGTAAAGTETFAFVIENL
ncbi:right-handed parallel beta-helix repeat-containing protein [Pseudomonas aeruginosa]|uniref:right-handed parallel beta-helix repeat-containing protein n=1 Tax=Pseudomonas aeruginosa TaxID=287 RepID=UPI000FC425D9|nr:right-handed parallel beta-helix repeat-containing protein [Pseudomonas aeruginosa]MDN3885941.1 right-handed parallel beta-helix repeat-containing protein [Pseudomonas aeruginosa]MDN3898003.1 right-handed parallel beta-helix repeat-containing protein [Pseudomonas aeruginosa]RUB64196.1 right-handed parallel beta-helix repeat-containing protein [Pseudomonas aeruginosa]HCP6210678.1 right-handed parallel beta-helix repeat-containing protein [Pseudomonas aeruginosa]HCP6216355.1 right-handed para